MEEKKIWHDAKNETPETDRIIALIYEDFEGTKNLVHDACYGKIEEPYVSYDGQDITMIDNDYCREDINIPDYPIYYCVLVDPSVDAHAEFYYYEYEMYTKPIKWAYANELDNWIIEKSKED